MNDLGGGADGTGADSGPAHEVVEEIRAFGGEAVAHTENVATWDGGRSVIQTALDSFGELHVLDQQCGDPPRPDAHEHVRGGVGRGRQRPPQRALRPHAVRRRVLAGPGQGRDPRAGLRGRDLVHLGVVRQRRADELRRGEDRHRNLHDHLPDGARALRGPLQRDRPGGHDPPDPDDPRRGEPREAEGGRVQRVRPGERLALRRVPRDGGLPDPGARVLRGRGRGRAVPAVRDRRPHPQGRTLDRRGAPEGRRPLRRGRVRSRARAAHA